MAKKEQKKEIKPKNVPIIWRMPDIMQTPFATNMFIQTIEDEFKISFFEIKPPIRFNDNEPWPETVNADYVTGVIVTPKRLEKFIKALQDHLNKYNAKKNSGDQENK